MHEVFRFIQPDGGGHKGTSVCRHEGCTKTTREAKPYCSEHIENGWYIQRVLAELERAEEEEAILASGEGRIPRTGFYYRETLLLLRSKDFTGKGLARRLDICHPAALRLIVLLTEDGLARSSMTSRGDMTVSGTGSQDLLEDGE